jgi:hypothetical protein
MAEKNLDPNECLAYVLCSLTEMKVLGGTSIHYAVYVRLGFKMLCLGKYTSAKLY